MTFNGTIYFTNNGHNKGETDILNRGIYGGAMFMGLNSTASILPNSTVYWVNNHASYRGAIYIFDASPLSYCNDTRGNTLLGLSIAAYIPSLHS